MWLNTNGSSSHDWFLHGLLWNIFVFHTQKFSLLHLASAKKVLTPTLNTENGPDDSYDYVPPKVSLQRNLFKMLFLEFCVQSVYCFLCFFCLLSLKESASPQLRCHRVPPSTSRSWCHPVRTRVKKRTSGVPKNPRKDAECQRKRKQLGWADPLCERTQAGQRDNGSFPPL